MGVNGLWKILSPVAQVRSFAELAVREGFEDRRHSTGVIVVGVDASTWFYECQGVFCGQRHSHAQAGENPELRTLVYRLNYLSCRAVNAVFVFDGPNRPKRKRGKNVRSLPHWMTERFKELAEAFGFYCHTAPGEAEAELAYLNKIHAIDLVLTADSDVFLFGATHVMRSPQDIKDRDNVEIYTADAFASQNDRVFSPAGIFFIAVMNGGDYNSGLRGCGQAIAHALASSPLASSLYDAVTTLSNKHLWDYLVQWRLDLQDELLSDRHGLLGRKYPALAHSIPSCFPDRKVLYLYCNPLTSRSLGISPDTLPWLVPCLPNTEKLAVLFDRLFGWHSDILTRMSANVWEGLFIRQLSQSSITAVPDNADLGPNSIRYITQVTNKISSPSAFPSYRVEIWLTSVTLKAVNAICTSPSEPIPGGTTCTSRRLWVPGPILSAAVRDQVATFHADHSCLPASEKTYIPVLSHVNVSAIKKEKTAFSGPSGSMSMKGQFLGFVDLTEDPD